MFLRNRITRDSSLKAMQITLILLALIILPSCVAAGESGQFNEAMFPSAEDISNMDTEIVNEVRMAERAPDSIATNEIDTASELIVDLETSESVSDAAASETAGVFIISEKSRIHNVGNYKLHAV